MLQRHFPGLPLSTIALLVFLIVPFFAVSQSRLSEKDRTRLAEAYRLSDSLGNQLWNGWTQVPFSVLLITDSTEFLIRHSSPDSTFINSGYDSVLQSTIYARPRSLPTSLLASFPYNGVPTTVIGVAENTDSKTSTPWIVTLLHEHFHQLQNSQPEYFNQVNLLNLSGGDKTGMWMLNYPFPYDSADVQAGFDRMKIALGDAVTAPDSLVSAKFKDYCAVRHDFMQKLREPDRKYMSFQLWQEGVARYTEFRIAEWAGSKYQPSARFQTLSDYEPVSTIATMQLQQIKNAPYQVSLGQYQRVSFYIIGSAEACLLTRVNPEWRDGYFKQMLTLDPWFDK